MHNHGTDPRTRMAIMAERVEAMKAIWTHDEASYHGDHVDFERIWSWPKPAQRPHPPVLVGGNGPTVLDRVLDFGDAWLPNYTAKTCSTGTRAVGPGRAPDRCDRDGRARQAGGARGVREGRRATCRALDPLGALGPVERALERWEGAIAELHGE